MVQQHPFAKFVRTLGRGAKLSRSLDQEEAHDAMALILAGGAEPAQVGAFLVLLRYRGETPDELAGFVRAAREAIGLPDPAPAVDLDWPSYADRHHRLPWFVLAALLLAENGVRVLMHGIAGESEGYAPTPAALKSIGVGTAASLTDAAGRLQRDNFAYLPLDRFFPALDEVFALRPLLGVRSAVNSLARELNPCRAPYQLQGVFHPNYLTPHQRTADLLGQPHAAVFKGGGGEVQRNPEKPLRIATVHDGVLAREGWPAMIDDGVYKWREETAETTRIGALWRGEFAAAAPEAAVIGTAAIALRLLGRAEGPAEADAMAHDMWRNRRRERYGPDLALTRTSQTRHGLRRVQTAAPQGAGRKA